MEGNLMQAYICDDYAEWQGFASEEVEVLVIPQNGCYTLGDIEVIFEEDFTGKHDYKPIMVVAAIYIGPLGLLDQSWIEMACYDDVEDMLNGLNSGLDPEDIRYVTRGSTITALRFQ